MKGILRIFRLSNAIMGVVAVVVGFLVASKQLMFTDALGYAALSAFFISGAGMIANDIFDYEIDQRSKKKKPLVSGELTHKGAVVLFLVCSAIGLVAAALTKNTLTFWLLFLGWLLFGLYAWKLSRMYIISNITVAATVGLAFVIGESLTGIILSPALRIVVVLAMFSTMAREIYLDIRDRDEDSYARHTIPVLCGNKFSAKLACLMVLASIAASIMPYMKGLFGMSYLGIVAIADVLFLVLAVTGLKQTRPSDFAFQGLHMKTAQAIALVAFLIGSLNI